MPHQASGHRPHLGGQQETDEFAAEHPEGVRGRGLGRRRGGRRALIAADVLAAAGIARGGARRSSGRAAQAVLHWDARQLQHDRQLSYVHPGIQAQKESLHGRAVLPR